MNKKIIILLLIFIIIFILLIGCILLKNSYFKFSLIKKLSDTDNLNNFIITTIQNNKLNAKTYCKDNLVMNEYYSENGDIIQNILTDYNEKKVYFYNINNNSAPDILNTDESERYNINKEVLDLLNSKDEKFEYIGKTKGNNEFYILKFTNKNNNNINIIFINSENNFMEKKLLYIDENNSVLIEEYTLELNQNVDSKIQKPNIY